MEEQMSPCRAFAEWVFSPEFDLLLMGNGAKKLIRARAMEALRRDMPPNLRVYPEPVLNPGPIGFKPGCV